VIGHGPPDRLRQGYGGPPKLYAKAEGGHYVLTWAAAALALVVVAGGGFVHSQAPSWAANALLHPGRRPVDHSLRGSFEDVAFSGAGVVLKGWRFGAIGEKRGTLVSLHGIGDNRMSAVGTADRFTRRGFEVLAYDSRAQGESDGSACTYGYYEKEDLRRVLDTTGGLPIVVLGSSLGAAVAVQAAADDARIRVIVAAEIFSDLRTVARYRARFFLTDGMAARAFALAEQRGAFQVDAVSPVAAAARLTIPVLLIHGAVDHNTPPDHSQRVFDALRGPKRLILVPGAAHNQSLSGPVWRDIEEWVDVNLR
jgi:pimeloyl-ACP methyl ester carboxylesterase